jgi:hypothetical protein
MQSRLVPFEPKILCLNKICFCCFQSIFSALKQPQDEVCTVENGQQQTSLVNSLVWDS